MNVLSCRENEKITTYDEFQTKSFSFELILTCYLNQLSSCTNYCKLRDFLNMNATFSINYFALLNFYNLSDIRFKVQYVLSFHLPSTRYTRSLI